MPEPCAIRVDGAEVQALEGESLAVALLRVGVSAFRTSCRGEGRAPFCGMGTCHECQVRVDGRWVRACLEPVRAGQEVQTHG